VRSYPQACVQARHTQAHRDRPDLAVQAPLDLFEPKAASLASDRCYLHSSHAGAAVPDVTGKQRHDPVADLRRGASLVQDAGWNEAGRARIHLWRVKGQARPVRQGQAGSGIDGSQPLVTGLGWHDRIAELTAGASVCKTSVSTFRDILAAMGAD
jgi:hypothetical protein